MNADIIGFWYRRVFGVEPAAAVKCVGYDYCIVVPCKYGEPHQMFEPKEVSSYLVGKMGYRP